MINRYRDIEPTLARVHARLQDRYRGWGVAFGRLAILSSFVFEEVNEFPRGDSIVFRSIRIPRFHGRHGVMGLHPELLEYAD